MTISNESINITTEDVAVLTLGGSTGAWTFQTSKNSDKYLAYTKPSGTTKNNNLFVVDDASTSGATWTISVDDTGQATITNVYNNQRSLQFNSDRFCCYTSTQSPVALYKKVNSTAESTTTNIDATGITNTDVYTSTIAGSLSATVKDDSNNTISGATVTWSGNNDAVATIDEATGDVTLVAAGTVTFTASYAGVTDEYQASFDTYEMTVTSSAPYVQPTEFDIAFNNTAFGCGTGNNAEEQSFTINNIEVVAGCSSSASSKTYYDSGHVRFYADSYLVLTAPTGYNITKIVFTANGTWNGSITPDDGSYDNTNKTWTGSASSIQFNFAAQNRIASAAITLSDGSAAATTITISASGITNTDVYVNTTAGSLAATVFDEDNNEVSGATVTWSSSDTDVATIDENTGVVTLVAAGTVTFTVTYDGEAGTYQASYNTYEMTVTSSEPYVQPTEIEITPNYTFWGKTAQFSGSDNDDLSGSQDNVSLAWSRGTGSTYANTTAMRFYKDNTLTFTAPTGYEIKSIELEVSGTYDDLTFSPTGFDSSNTTWTGSSQTVTMSRPSNASSYSTISKFTITIGLPSSVVTPTFSVASGTFIETQNVKVSNYDDDYMYFYTTDGTNPDCDANLDPTGTSVAYSHSDGIDISATTTLKMIAVDIDGNKSAVATAEYTFPTIYTTIAAFKELEANTTGYLNLTGAQVVYIDAAKKNIYVRDASGAIDLFNNSGFTTTLTTGDILSGTIYGKYSPYKNLPEITNIEDISVLTATSNQTVVAKVIDGTTAAIAENLCDLVKIENTEITESESNYYVGDNSEIKLYDNFSVGYIVTTGKAVDVSGIATVYNTTYELFPRYEGDIVYLESSEAVSISAVGYSTYASDNALDFTGTDAIKVFYATVSGSTLTFHKITKVPAETGVLLVSAAGGAVAETHVPYVETGTATDAVTGNAFVRGTGASVTWASENEKYVLFNGDEGIGFYKANNNPIATNRAYIQVPAGTGVKSFAINLEDTDAIKAIAGESENAVIYNLAGQRVNKAQKGIYIINGKKVLVK